MGAPIWTGALGCSPWKPCLNPPLCVSSESVFRCTNKIVTHLVLSSQSDNVDLTCRYLALKLRQLKYYIKRLSLFAVKYISDNLYKKNVALKEQNESSCGRLSLGCGKTLCENTWIHSAFCNSYWKTLQRKAIGQMSNKQDFISAVFRRLLVEH